MDWIKELEARGVDVRRDDMVRTAAEQFDRNYGACLLARPTGGGYEVNLVLRTDLDDAAEQWIGEEAAQRFDRLAEVGPEPDGWQERSDSDLQLWMTAHQVDPWLTEHE